MDLPRRPWRCGPELGLATAAKGSLSWMLGWFRASELFRLGATGGSGGPRDHDAASGGLSEGRQTSLSTWDIRLGPRARVG